MKTEEMLILGLTGAAAYLVWRMKSQKSAMVTQSITAPVARSPVSTAVVPVGSQQPTMPIWTTPNVPAPAPKPGVGRWLDQTTYRLEMPPTRDIMPQFLMNPPECKKPTMADRPGDEAYWKCQYAKSEECRAKGGSVVMSAFEPMGPNSYGAKYGYCVDREPPKEPTEAIKILEKRCPTLPSRCQGQACPAIYESNYSMQVFGKDPNHRHGQYQIWKCAK